MARRDKSRLQGATDAIRHLVISLLLAIVFLPGGKVSGTRSVADAPIASMGIPREGHTATRLLDGRVLVTGGQTLPPIYGLLASAEIYDPMTNSWRAVAPMAQARAGHSATLLRDGRVLVVQATSAELYDPLADRWSPTGVLRHPHYSSPAVLLADGSVLLAGGGEYFSSETPGDYVCSGPKSGAVDVAELYEPTTGTWRTVGSMTVRRTAHTLTPLADGGALAVGGLCARDGLDSAERYDPVSQQWQRIPSLDSPRFGHSTIALADGRLIVFGGAAAPGGYGQSVPGMSVFEPRSRTWGKLAPPPLPVAFQKALRLADGRVLTFGNNVSQIYDPRVDAWMIVGQLQGSSATAPVVLLNDGRALFVAGRVGEAELFDPLVGRWEASAQELTTRACFPTGYCVRGPFQAHWQDYLHSPIAKTGYPISDEFTEILEDGEPHIVQYFERIRLEYHPQAGNLPAFQFGQFGRRIHPVEPPVPSVPGARNFPETGDGARYFPETGHNLQGRFLDYWWNNGALLWYGYPLSEEFDEVLEDGKTYRVQYFERARFEYHPENVGTPYEVLLGHFGRRILAEANPVH